MSPPRHVGGGGGGVMIIPILWISLNKVIPTWIGIVVGMVVVVVVVVVVVHHQRFKSITQIPHWVSIDPNPWVVAALPRIIVGVVVVVIGQRMMVLVMMIRKIIGCGRR